MTDIWRSFVAQAVLWSEGKRLSFSASTVIQVRNEHNLMRDFSDEIDGYLGNRKICSILREESAKWTSGTTIKERVLCAWEALNKEGFIEDRELGIIRLWMAGLND